MNSDTNQAYLLLQYLGIWSVRGSVLRLPHNYDLKTSPDAIMNHSVGFFSLLTYYNGENANYSVLTSECMHAAKVGAHKTEF